MSDWRHLQQLEAESIHIMREVVAECQRPVLLYSIGKDSSVLLRLAQKAFYPGPIPFPLLHVDTGYKFREMIEFRDRYTAELGLKLIVHTNSAALDEGANPFAWGTQRCCGALKTHCAPRRLARRRIRRGHRRRAARRRAVARQGARLLLPRHARPMGSAQPAAGALESVQHPHPPRREHPRVSALELDRARRLAIHPRRKHPDRAAVFRQSQRPMLVRGDSLLPVEQPFVPRLPGEEPQMVMCRMRSLGCSPCTGAIRSEADTVPKIIEELISVRRSERQNRVIDHDQDGSMEIKKQEGYF